MNRIKIVLLYTISLLALAARAEKTTITINANAGKPISPYLYGLFFEDIQYGADGGLYAELVQSRSFEYFNIEPRDHLREQTAGDMNPMYAWEVIERGGQNATPPFRDGHR